MNQRQARTYALRLAEKLGMQLAKRTPGRCCSLSEMAIPSWDGHALSTENTIANLFHEISHYVIAPKCRRALVAFGLGDEPWGCRAPMTVGRSKAHQEEEQASVLGICYERALGLDWWKTALDHNWFQDDSDCDDEFLNTLAKLNKRGLLRGWMPTFVL